ncbi:MAG: glutathione S-transferase [Pseudomonadota bacterium]
MADYTLHCFKDSGNAYKVALMMTLAGVKWRSVWVDFFKGETRSDAYREELNEMGEVPVLEHNGRKLSQTGVILDYLVEQTGKFAPADRREGLRWVFWDNHKLTSYTATYRFLRNFMKDTDPAVLDFLEGRMRAAFKVLDTHLAGRDFMVGDTLSTADLSICGYLFFEDEFGVVWSDYPNIAQWLGRIRAVPGWQHPYEMLPDGPV